MEVGARWLRGQAGKDVCLVPKKGPSTSFTQRWGSLESPQDCCVLVWVQGKVLKLNCNGLKGLFIYLLLFYFILFFDFVFYFIIRFCIVSYFTLFHCAGMRQEELCSLWLGWAWGEHGVLL